MASAYDAEFEQFAWPCLLAEFGETATVDYEVAPADSSQLASSSTITAVRFPASILPAGISTHDLQPKAWAVDEDAVAAPKRGDRITFEGTTWSVFGVSVKLANFFVLDVASNQR